MKKEEQKKGKINPEKKKTVRQCPTAYEESWKMTTINKTNEK